MLEAARPINNILFPYFDVVTCGTAWYVRLAFGLVSRFRMRNTTRHSSSA